MSWAHGLIAWLLAILALGVGVCLFAGRYEIRRIQRENRFEINPMFTRDRR